MNDFLHVLVGLVFGAGATYLLATVRELNRRRPRAIEARAALENLIEHFDSLTRSLVHAGNFAQLDALQAVHTHSFRANRVDQCRREICVLTKYIIEDVVATHTQEELRIQLGALPERAP